MNSKFSLLQAFKCAFEGIFATAKERNFKIELCFMTLAIVLGLVFSISFLEWLCVIICFGLVLGGEVINSAIEAVVDLASPEYHELAKKLRTALQGEYYSFLSLHLLLAALFLFLVSCRY